MGTASSVFSVENIALHGEIGIGVSDLGIDPKCSFYLKI